MKRTLSLVTVALVFFGMTVSAPTLAASTLRVGTFNIRNYDYDSREKIHTNESELSKILSDATPDLMGVQEIVNGERFQQYVESALPGYAVALAKCGGGGEQKPGLLYRKSELELVDSKEDQRVNGTAGCNKGVRPAFIARFKHKTLGTTFTAVVLHLKAGGAEENTEQRFKQLAAVTQILKEIRAGGQKNIAVMGDLNTTEYSLMGQGHQRFVTFTEVNQLRDYSKDLRCTAYWWGGTEDGIEEGSVLDHVMLSNEFAASFQTGETALYSHCKKVSCENISVDALGLSYAQVSDHCPVVAVLKK